MTMPDVRVSVFPYERDNSNIKALVKVILDDSFIINNISVLEGRNGKNFVAMPSYKTNQKDEYGREIYRDICYPVTKEFREKLFDEILNTYEREKDRQVVNGYENKNKEGQIKDNEFMDVSAFDKEAGMYR